MDTASRQDWIIGHARNGSPIYAIAGAEGEGGDGGGDAGKGAGSGDAGKDDAAKGGGDDKSKDEFKPIQDQAALDRIVQSRLAREREKFADHDELKKKAEEFDKLQESQKTELQKATDKQSAAEKRAADAELRAMKLEVAADKGLNPTQAKRLVGATKEELEADADELLESFKPNEDGKKPPGKGGTERLRGGGSPDETPDEKDPKKLTEGLPSIA